MSEEEEKQWQDAGFPGLPGSTENLGAPPGPQGQPGRVEFVV